MDSPALCGVHSTQQHTSGFRLRLKVCFLVFMQYVAYSWSWKVLNNKKKKNGISHVNPSSCCGKLEYFLSLPDFKIESCKSVSHEMRLLQNAIFKKETWFQKFKLFKSKEGWIWSNVGKAVLVTPFWNKLLERFNKNLKGFKNISATIKVHGSIWQGLKQFGWNKHKLNFWSG